MSELPRCGFPVATPGGCLVCAGGCVFVFAGFPVGFDLSCDVGGFSFGCSFAFALLSVPDLSFSFGLGEDCVGGWAAGCDGACAVKESGSNECFVTFLYTTRGAFWVRWLLELLPAEKCFLLLKTRTHALPAPYFSPCIKPQPRAASFFRGTK